MNIFKRILGKIICPNVGYCKFEGEHWKVVITVQATGVIGRAYTTQTGMEIADPYVDWYAWTQISETERVCGYSEFLSSQFGVVGEVYKTSVGMDLADVEKDTRGWEQVYPTKRVLVESRDIGGHQRWWVWQRVEGKVVS